MSRCRIINSIICILFIVLASIITFAGGLYLESEGLLFKEFIGISMINWFQIIIGLLIIGLILYDFSSIRVKRKKYGDVKYILKRKNKIKQVIGLIVMVIALCVQTYFLTNGFKKLDSNIIVLLYFNIPLLWFFGYHNFEKEGLGEEGIYYWGDVLTWDKVLKEDFKEDKLILTVSKRSYGKDEKFEIPFSMNGSEKIEIEKFLSDRISYEV